MGIVQFNFTKSSFPDLLFLKFASLFAISNAMLITADAHAVNDDETFEQK